jgi:hypothetical protein
MALLTATTLARAGVDPVPSAAADVLGDEVLNPSGDAYFIVKNGGGSGITVTLPIRATGPDGATVTNPTVTVPAAGTRIIGPFPVSIYNDASGKAKITYSGVTSVTVLAVRSGL